MSDEKLLEIDNLYIEGYYENDWHTIVEGIGLCLQPGEVLGLIGESGAGKSTVGLASMGYTRQGCRLASGSISSTPASLIGPNRNPSS